MEMEMEMGKLGIGLVSGRKRLAVCGNCRLQREGVF